MKSGALISDVKKLQGRNQLLSNPKRRKRLVQFWFITDCHGGRLCIQELRILLGYIYIFCVSYLF